jgi:hypothetical protein
MDIEPAYFVALKAQPHRSRGQRPRTLGSGSNAQTIFKPMHSLDVTKYRRTILPLPAGEGRGEGESFKKERFTGLWNASFRLFRMHWDHEPKVVGTARCAVTARIAGGMVRMRPPKPRFMERADDSTSGLLLPRSMLDVECSMFSITHD